MEKMKKFFGILTMLTLVFTAFSCSENDDPEETKTDISKLVEGTFSGWSAGSCAYFSDYGVENTQVQLTANGDGTVNVAYTSQTWGNTTIQNVAVTQTTTGYSLSGSGKYSMSMGSNSSEYDCNLSGTISSDKQTYTLTFSLPSVMGGLNITFQNGTAPLSKMVAGSYSGWSVGNCAYFQNYGAEASSVSVTANEDGTVNVAFSSDTWGGTTIENVAVASSADGYTLSGSGKYTMGMGGSGSASAYDCNLTATISSDLSTYSFNFELPAVMGGLTISFQNGSVPAALALAGTYSGWSAGSSAYFSGYGAENTSVKITANEDGTMSVAYTSETWGNVTIDGVEATQAEDGSYSLSGTGTFSMGMPGSTAKDYDCELTGTISADKQTYTINFKLPAVMGGLTIVFQNGTAPETSEE